MKELRQRYMNSNPTNKSSRPPARLINAFIARNRRFDLPDPDEMPWIRVPAMGRIELPRPVVLVNGAFDLLHAGHAKLIFAARDQAKTLVCALDSDDKVSMEKGVGRPIQTYIERATMLGFMPIDVLVEVGSAKEMHRLIAALRPDLRVQGAEYASRPTR